MTEPAVSYTVSEIAERINARCQGDGSVRVFGVAELGKAQAGQVSFLHQAKYRTQLDTTKASAVLVTPELAEACQTTALITDNPYFGYAQVAALFDPASRQPEPGIHETVVMGKNCTIADTATVGPNVVLGDGVKLGHRAVVGAGCFLGDGCSMGHDSRLLPNVTLYSNTQLGSHVMIHSGAVLGCDGFGNAQREDGTWFKIPQLGRVVVEDNVEIGSNTTIDRGAISDTVIGKGARLDNQIQIAHNVIIGENTAIAGCVGIAGSTHIGKNCRIGGGALINGHITVCDNVDITAASMLLRSITEPGVYSSGMPATDNKTWRKNITAFMRLHKMASALRKQKV